MFLSALNRIRKFQFDLESLIISRYRSNPGFLSEIKILFQKISEETVLLQNSILKRFKEIEFQISKQEYFLSERIKISEELSELSAFQAQFNILIEIQTDIERKLRKKKWFTDKLELIIKTPSLEPEPELIGRPKLPLRKPKRKIGNETRTISQNESRSSDGILSSQNLSDNNPKKKMELFPNEPSEVLEMADIELDTFPQKIDSNSVPYKQTFHQQTKTITHKQEQLSQEIFSSKKVDMSLPFSSLSLNNNFSQDTNLFDSQSENTTLMLETTTGSHIIGDNDTHNLSLSQELFPIENLFQRKTKKFEKESTETNIKVKIIEKPIFLQEQKNSQLSISNPSCDVRNSEKSLKAKHSQATNKTKFLPTTDISKDFPINLQTQLNPIKSFHKQSSILKYVSPPRNKHITDISVGCKSLTHKNKDFSAEGHQSKSKFESTNSNPRVNTKQPNRPFYSMNILMIQREEIIYDFPDSFWMSEEFPSKLISQFEDDLDYS